MGGSYTHAHHMISTGRILIRYDDDDGMIRRALCVQGIDTLGDASLLKPTELAQLVPQVTSRISLSISPFLLHVRNSK
jgi:hypothetical protein